MKPDDEVIENMLGKLMRTPDNPSRLGRMGDRLIQPGSSIHTRLVPDIEVPDVESMPATYLLTALMHLAKNIGRLEKKIADSSRYVDEYVPNQFGMTIAQNSTLEVLPQFDQIPERIVSVLITGPASAVSLQLGDRLWNNLNIPVAGFLVIGPIDILLTRNDRRLLTPTSTSGNYTLELMGYADERFVS